jgi:hypothetical protein
VIVGIFLVGCLAPIADVFYTWDVLENFILFQKSTKLGNWYYIFNGLLVSTVLWVLTDYMAWRKYHREDSYEKRIDTIDTAYKYQLLDKATLADQYYITNQERKAKNY